MIILFLQKLDKGDMNQQKKIFFSNFFKLHENELPSVQQSRNIAKRKKNFFKEKAADHYQNNNKQGIKEK